MRYDNYMPVKIISGDNCVKKYNFSSWGRRCIIMTGKSGALKSGLLADLEKHLTEQLIEYFIFDGILENPTVESCFEAGAYACEFNANFIIGAGGGSVLDATKAASIFATNPLLEAMELFNATQIITPLPTILIGTTAGTGSEVTPVSVLTINTDGVPLKKSYRSHLIYAKVALCDPRYTMSLSWEQTTNTALDTICHLVEALYSVRAGSFEELYALEGLKVGWKAFIKAHWRMVFEKQEVEYSQREQLLYASIMGGLSINGTGTCFPHTLSYALTTIKGVPHGKACAYFLGEFVRLMHSSDERKTSILLKAVNEDTLDAFLVGIQSMVGELEILTNEEAMQFTEYIKNAASLDNSIIPINSGTAYKIYKKLFVK